MKTKNRKAKTGMLDPVEATREAFGADSVTESTDPSPTNGYKPGSKLQISLKEDGSIDWDSMRESTREKVKQAFRSSNIKPENGQPEVQMFNSAMVFGMYDMLGAIEATAAQRFGKIPPHIAKQVFTYTPSEKNALEGPTVRVLNKYIPDWMIKYQDEIALASTLIAITTAKVNAAITLTNMSQAQSVEMPQKQTDEPTPPTQVQ